MSNTERKIKRIGILTSGGDAPGMNAVIRAVVRAAYASNVEVMGIRNGYRGLMERDMYLMSIRDVSNVIQKPGTMLYSARCTEFAKPEGVAAAVEVCNDPQYKLDGIVTIGGDGTFRGARDLSNNGINCIGIPATIDNDIACSDYTIGYDTCLNTIVNSVDAIRATSESHSRCTVVEVMGAGAGYLALYGGLVEGATAILLPEVEYDFQTDIIDRMLCGKNSGKRHFIVMAAESVIRKYEKDISNGDEKLYELIKGSGAQILAQKIEAATKTENEPSGIVTRATVLGHVQRGGIPTYMDRYMGSIMGEYAVRILLEGKSQRVVCFEENKIIDRDINQALSMPRVFNKKDHDIAKMLSI